MKLTRLLKNVDYTFIREIDAEITDLVYDSRKADDGVAFVCLKGYTSDGHKFAESAVKKGASALVISDDLDFTVDDGVQLLDGQSVVSPGSLIVPNHEYTLRRTHGSNTQVTADSRIIFSKE